MNYVIENGTLIIPAIVETILGEETIVSEPKEIGKITDLMTTGIKTFDGFGSKLYLIRTLDKIKNSDLSNDTVKYYDIEKLDDEHVLIIINRLKSTATVNMIARANEFHQTAIEKLTMMIS